MVMISSSLMTGEYQRLVVDYQPYRERQVEALVADKMNELESEELLADGSEHGLPSAGSHS